MSATLYTTDLLRLATSLADWPRLADPDTSSEKRSVVCGSSVAVDVILDDEQRVIAFGQDVKACALGQASAALLAKNIIGRSASEIEDANRQLRSFLSGEAPSPGDWPGLDALRTAQAYPARHASIRLAFEAAADAALRAENK